MQQLTRQALAYRVRLQRCGHITQVTQIPLLSQQPQPVRQQRLVVFEIVVVNNAAKIVRRGIATGTEPLQGAQGKYFQHPAAADIERKNGNQLVVAMDTDDAKRAVSLSKRTTLVQSIGEGDAFANQVRFAYSNFLKERIKNGRREL